MCKKLKREQLIQVASHCGVIRDEEEAYEKKMTKNQLCELLKGRIPPDVAATIAAAVGEPALSPPSPVRPAPVPVRPPSPTESISCNAITDAICNKLTKAKLLRLATSCGVIEDEDAGAAMSKGELCELLKGMAPASEPSLPEGVCYKGKTLEELKSAKTPLSELKKYAEELGIKNVFSKNELAEYICSAGNWNVCADDGCENGEYCDMSNNLCVPQAAARAQLDSKAKYVRFEHEGKIYMGKANDINKLKARLVRPSPSPSLTVSPSSLSLTS